MMDSNDNYYEMFISLAIVSAMMCVIAAVSMGIGKLIGWML
ncbi:hypothetical protein SH449x_000764 [Pirellulaceae bacterium SH449]